MEALGVGLHARGLRQLFGILKQRLRRLLDIFDDLGCRLRLPQHGEFTDFAVNFDIESLHPCGVGKCPRQFFDHCQYRINRVFSGRQKIVFGGELGVLCVYAFADQKFGARLCGLRVQQFDRFALLPDRQNDGGKRKHGR